MTPRLAFLALSALPFCALSACSQLDALGDQVVAAVPRLAGGGAERDGTNQGIRTLSLFDGSVRVRGPEGYCIDRQASRTRTGFAVLAACARVSEAELLPSLDGFLTVQIGDAGTAVVAGNEAVLAGLLEEREGAGLLSNGDGDVDVHQTLSEAGLVLVRYTDPDAPEMQGTVPSGWRAFLDLKDRSAVVSVRSFAQEPLSLGEGEALIRAAAAALKDANQSSQD